MNIASLSSLSVGFDTLRANPLRTTLSTLGIVIGVASLVAVLSLGDGVQQFVREQIERTTDVQTIVVTPKTTEEVNGQLVARDDVVVFTVDDALQAAALPNVLAATVGVQGQSLVTCDGSTQRRAANVTAVTAGAATFNHIALESGRFFTDAEVAHGDSVAVVSANLGVAVGSTIRSQGVPLRVIGVLAPATVKEPRARLFVPLSIATFVTAPAMIASVPTLAIKASTVEQVDSVRAEAKAWLERRYGAQWSGAVATATTADRIAQVQKGTRLMKLVLGAFAGISLLVGGIGIMNILLASVTERTREIGIRKSAGARRRDVLLQFLAEAMTISCIGSAFGVVLGLAGAYGITAILRTFADTPALRAGFSPMSVLIAILVALTTGLVFGTYPARRAAALSPVEAMRHE